MSILCFAIKKLSRNKQKNCNVNNIIHSQEIFARKKWFETVWCTWP